LSDIHHQIYELTSLQPMIFVMFCNMIPAVESDEKNDVSGYYLIRCAFGWMLMCYLTEKNVAENYEKEDGWIIG
jgi:hypothetical protein